MGDMTVAELIEHLRSLPQDAKVYVDESNGDVTIG
ncbi:hypothetical protein SEA_KUWABARA_39 [Gordonia phage Kuwabara]|nr:hypothetical protein SEA_KUWABARA_39 [Gordonia phage Kuwabara]